MLQIPDNMAPAIKKGQELLRHCYAVLFSTRKPTFTKSVELNSIFPGYKTWLPITAQQL